MKSSLSFLFIFFLRAFSVAAQTTVSIPAAADNTLYENPSGNSNALGQNIFSGTNGGGSPRRGLIRFDVASAVPANAIITAVTLTLNCNTSRSVADNVALHKVSAAWGEGTSNAGTSGDGQGVAATTNDATWATRFFPGTTWTTAGGDYTATASASVSINNTGFYQWNSTAMAADVQSWINSPASNFGWMLICNESTVSTARKFGSRENATAANRPSLSVIYTTTLPVTLTYFKALPKNGGVLLRWETSQETDNRYFEILHSRDGILFSPVGKVTGAGTSATKQEYSFTHDTVASGSHFYKLAQVDFDGKRKYSAVERVYTAANSGGITLFPNPVLDKLTVLSNRNLPNAAYKIISPNGSVLVAGVLGSGVINVDGLAPGIYYLYLYTGNGLVSQTPFGKR